MSHLYLGVKAPGQSSPYCFEWDDAKNQSNQGKHGIAFEDIVPVFFTAPCDIPSPQKDEQRWVRIVKLNSLTSETFYVGVVYTQRNDRNRIISVRRARNNEKEAYCELYP